MEKRRSLQNEIEQDSVNNRVALAVKRRPVRDNHAKSGFVKNGM